MALIFFMCKGKSSKGPNRIDEEAINDLKSEKQMAEDITVINTYTHLG